MKKLILLMMIIGLWTQIGQASVAFEVEGTLRVQETIGSPLKMFIETDEGTLNLSNVHTPYGSGCTYGRYTVVNNIVPEGTYTLLEMNECLDDTLSGELKDGMIFCPEIWMPVCGQPKMNDCASGMACIQVMPKKRTFGNLCELNASKAAFVHMGECHR
ncbi:MAG: hypothetical protein KC493_14360 [Bacteriovoracaceae bacterium]|nr:hypothetical protein [Bacteriovoracaceae bacterium]